jgi:elongation factor P
MIWSIDMFYSTSDFSRGIYILYNNEPHEIIDYSYHKPGKGASIVRTKLKNLITKSSLSRTFRSGDKLERADLYEKTVQFTYKDGKSFFFIDTENFEEFSLSYKKVGDNHKFLSENMEMKMQFFNEAALNIELPNHISLKVTESHSIKAGNTVGHANKEVLLETGFVCIVPIFIKTGDIIKIDTRTSLYISKENQKH